MSEHHWTAFAGHRCLAAGPRDAVARTVKQTHDDDPERQVVVFDDATGRQVDMDLRGSMDDVVERIAADARPPTTSGKRPVGRPRLGVTAREVTLLPRHWEWLARQPGGASGTLRRLVEAARVSPEARRRQAQAVADRFMVVVAGNLPGYEDAARALYAGDAARFTACLEPWPRDVREHALRLARDAFETGAKRDA